MNNILAFQLNTFSKTEVIHYLLLDVPISAADRIEYQS